MRKLSADALQPMRGGVHEKRAHDLSRTQARADDLQLPRGEVTAPSALPPLYAKWMKDALPGAIPSEPHATCDDCAMQPPPRGKLPEDTLYFGSSTKCCTLIPNLPNFLAGRILADDDPHPAAKHGRDTVLARIRSRAAVTPLGLGRTLGFSLHYRHHAERFGQSVALRCPHYVEDGGLCGVWKHRESTCATWFCKHERGVVAVRFWSGLQQLLSAVEHGLAYWCARELGLDSGELRAEFQAGAMSLSTSKGTFASHLLDGQLAKGALDRHRLGARDASAHAKLFGAWAGRETELFVECAKRVEALSWSEIVALFGARMIEGVEELTARYHALRSNALPARLASRNGELDLVQIGKRHLRVDSYRAHDPLKAPKELIDALPSFDGRTREEAIASIKAEHGLMIDEALVRKLVDFGLLVEDA